MGFLAQEMRFTMLITPKGVLQDRGLRGMGPRQKIRTVLGGWISRSAGRAPYLYGCMVLSFDGKMGFPDDPEGP